MQEQRILCIERQILEGEIAQDIPLGLTVNTALFQRVSDVFRSRGEFRVRATVEDDPTYLQPIVYGVVTDGTRVLALQRTERKGNGETYVETRHNRMIGLACGGHVEPFDDLSDSAFFAKAMARELSEELIMRPLQPTFQHVSPVGILFHNETVFDRVHLGIIYRVLSTANVKLPEGSDEYDAVMFLQPSELAPYRDRMEGWGRVLTDAILSGHFPLHA